MTQYATDANLAARQRLWATSRTEPLVDFFGWVLELAHVSDGDRVLEVGCGNGLYLERLPAAVGMDLSPGMLAAARARAEGPLVNADAQRVPFASASFDVVLAPHMLYHVPDRVAAAAELRRVTRPGGRCVAATNSEENHGEMVGLVESVVGREWRWQRSAMRGFSMENGGAQLATAFDSVERVDAPARAVHVTDADTFTGYLLSIGDLYEHEIGRPWSDVAEECGRRCAEVIERDGSFRITVRQGAFVCR